MRRIWLVVKREYLTRVRTRGFLIGTLAVPLITAAVFFLPIVVARRQAAQTLQIAIVDETGRLAADVARALESPAGAGEPTVQVTRTFAAPSAAELDSAVESLRAEVQRGELDGFLQLSSLAVEEDKNGATFYTRRPGDLVLVRAVRQAVTDAVLGERLKRRGLEVENLRDLIRNVEVTLVNITKGGDVEEKGQTVFTAVVLAMVLYMTLLAYGLATLRSVLEEKTTRIIEILISSLRPFQLLVGKLLGVAAVGFTQYLIWIVSAALIFAATSAMGRGAGESSLRLQLQPSHLAWMVVFYLVGYFLYASLYAAAGAIVSSDEDAQQVQAPMTILIVSSFMLFFAVLRDPGSPISVGLSLIPFFAPVLMMLRITLQTPPLWQIILSIALSLLATAGILHVSARIYRVGILMYGKRPSFGELWRWLKYT
jgi:ABC-2 type transport system permease protein